MIETILLLAAAAAVTAGAYWLLRKLFSSPSSQSSSSSQESSYERNERDYQQMEQKWKEEQLRAEQQAQERQLLREQEERRVERKARQVEKILQSEPLLQQPMLKTAGLGSQVGPDEQLDREMIMRIARSLDDNWLQLFSIAAAQQELNFDLDVTTERLLVGYPTSDMEPWQMASLDQLPSVLTEQLLMEDDEFYPELAQQTLLILQSFERLIHQKMLYMLVDGSQSMDNNMQRGVPKHIWARGISVNLLLRAVKGEAQYYLRVFDGGVHELHKATTPAEAQVLIDFILRANLSGSGTNIYGALKQALKDRRTLSGDIQKADILIISDGEDSSMNDTDRVRKDLGEDTRLHAALIGNESGALKTVATTYKSFN